MVEALTEKYRPKRLEELIGQERVKEVLSEFIKLYKEGKKKVLPHFLFAGPAGTGKTTTAYILSYELNIPLIELNASDERGIDVIRQKVKRLATSRGKRIILLDEADAMTPDAQQALRRIMERAEIIGRKTDGETMIVFILTANFPWKIIDPIKSRCVILPFSPLPVKDIVKILAKIAIMEGVTIETEEDKRQLVEALTRIVEISGGDMRKALKYLETVLSTTKKINVEAVKGIVSPEIVDEAVNLALSGDIVAAIRTIEDALAMNKLSPEEALYRFYKVALNFSDKKLMTKALIELRRVEEAIRLGGNPLIQFAGYLSTIWYVSMARGK